VSDGLLQRLGLQADLLATCAAGRPDALANRASRLIRSFGYFLALGLAGESHLQRDRSSQAHRSIPGQLSGGETIFRFRRARDPGRRERWLGAGTRTHRACFACDWEPLPRAAACPLRTTCGSTGVRATGARQRNGEAGAASGEAHADRTWLVGSTSATPIPRRRPTTFSGSLLQFVQLGRDSRARSGACSVYESDGAGPLADRRESGDRQAPGGTRHSAPASHPSSSQSATPSSSASAAEGRGDRASRVWRQARLGRWTDQDLPLCVRTCNVATAIRVTARRRSPSRDARAASREWFKTNADALDGMSRTVL
jgi:hypothetical protein